MKDEMKRESRRDSSPEHKLTYFEWVNGILEQHEITPRDPAPPRDKKDDKSAA